MDTIFPVTRPGSAATPPPASPQVSHHTTSPSESQAQQYSLRNILELEATEKQGSALEVTLTIATAEGPVSFEGKLYPRVLPGHKRHHAETMSDSVALAPRAAAIRLSTETGAAGGAKLPLEPQSAPATAPPGELTASQPLDETPSGALKAPDPQSTHVLGITSVEGE